jgi:hypothetical protein
MINESGIAKRVEAVIEEAFKDPGDSWAYQTPPLVP